MGSSEKKGRRRTWFGGRSGSADEAARRARKRDRFRLQPDFLGLEDRCLMTTFNVTNASDTAVGSLRWAIGEANVATTPSTIDFELGASAQTIVLTQGQLTLTDTSASITIADGPGEGPVTVSGNNKSRVFAVNSGVTASISGITISRGLVVYNYKTYSNGAGVENSGNLTVTDCTISGNDAANLASGGGVAGPGNFTLIDCTFSGNTAPEGDGAGLCLGGGTATLQNCTFSGNQTTYDGGKGGGLFVKGGSANLQDCTFTGNRASSGRYSGSGGGLENDGSNVTLSGCTFTANSATDGGGAIYATGGSTTLTACTISGNSSTSGGAGSIGGGVAIENGSGTFTDCTLSGNTSGRFGGGLYAYIHASGANLTLSNTTVAGNQAGYGGGGLSVKIGNGSEANLDACTIAGNSATSSSFGTENLGGGLSATLLSGSSSKVILEDTIVAGNTGSGTAASDISGSNSVGGADNLIGTGGAGGLTNGSSGNQVGVADPLLSPLGYYGGPTETVALIPGSPTIGRGVSLGFNTDERGQPRPTGSNTPVDIGAFQSQSSLVVNTTTDVATGSAAGQISLRAAIAIANVDDASETITFDPTVFAAEQTIALAQGPLELSDIGGTETIASPSAGLIINGESNGRVLQINSGVTAVLSGLTIMGGLDATGSGGGLYLAGTSETITNCTITGNSAEGGGGLYLANGTLALLESTISGNTATGSGGGLYIKSGTADISDSTISGNSAADGGGLSSTATATLVNCTLSGNSATMLGGAVYSDTSAALSIEASTIAGNSAGLGGGGLDITANSPVMEDTIVAGNTEGSMASDILGTLSGTSSYNLIGTGGSGGLTSSNHNQVNVASPGLGTLSNHGGPTATINLLAGSPAIGGGMLISGVTQDQRLLNRPPGNDTGGPIDIGAVEEQVYFDGTTPSFTTTVGVPSSFSLGAFGDGLVSSEYSVVVNWGDNSAFTSYALTSTGSLGSESHTHDAAGTFTIAVTVTDSSGENRTLDETVTVDPAATSASLTPATATAIPGQGVSFTETISAPTGETIVPTGTVEFDVYESGTSTLVGSGSATLAGAGMTNNTAVATFTTPTTLGVGNYTVTATYVNSDGDFTPPSQPQSAGLSLSGVATSTSLTSATTNSSSPTYGQMLTFDVAVAPTSAGGSSIGGSVQFYDGQSPLGSPVSLSNLGTCSLSIATLSAISHSITADYLGSGNFSPSDSTTLVVNVGPATPVVAVSDAGGLYSGDAFTATALVEGVSGGFAQTLEGVAPLLAYYDGSTATGTSSNTAPTIAGTYTVVATFNGSTDYSPASATKTFTIVKATPVVTVSDAGGTYNGASFAASSSITPHDSIQINQLETVPLDPPLYYTGTTTTGASTMVAPASVGTYTVAVTFPGSTDYLPVTATKIFTIATATPTVTVTDSSGTYTSSPFAAVATVAGVVTGVDTTPAPSLEGVTPALTYFVGTTMTGTPSSIAPTTAGTYTALATFPGSADYTSASAPTTFTIAQATPTINLNFASSYTVGSTIGANATITGAFGSGGTSLENVPLVLTYFLNSGQSLGTTAPTAQGNYSVMGSFAGSTDYVGVVTPLTSFSIVSKQVPVITVTDAGGPYTGAAYPATATISPNDGGTNTGTLDGIALTIAYYAGATATGSALAGAPNAPGTYTVVASYAGDSTYAATSSAPVTFSITSGNVVAGGLEFETVGPGNSFTVSNGVYTSVSGVQFGFVPGSGQSFVPLVELDGTVTIDTTAVTVAGTGALSAIISGTSIPLLTGGLATSSITTLINDGLTGLAGASLQVAGVSFTLSSVQLSASGPEIELQGSLALPVGLTVAVNGTNHVDINSSGLSLTGVSASLSGESFSLAGATFNGSSLGVDYHSSTETFAITGATSIAIPTLGTLSLTLGGGSTQGLVITDGTLTGLDATVSFPSTTLAGGTLTASDVTLLYQAGTQTAPAQLGLSGAADLTFGTNFDLSLVLGSSMQPGIVIENNSLISFDAAASLNTTLAGGTFTATDLGLTYVSASDVFTLTGSASLAFPNNGPDLSLTLGTTANPGMVFSGGTLSSLNATASFDSTIAGVSFSADALNVTYATATEVFTVTGAATMSYDAGLDSLQVQFGGGSTTGLVLSDGEVTSLNMTITSSLVAGGLTFNTTGLIVTDDVTATTSTVTITGASSFTAAGVGTLNVYFGTPGTQGLVIENGSLTSLDMTVTSTLNVGGISFTTTGLVITEDVSTGVFTITGASSFDVQSLGFVDVVFGMVAEAGNPGSTGLVIEDGSLASLDMTITSSFSAAGVSLSANNLHLVYNALASPTTFSLSGTTTAAFAGLGSFSATFGTAAHPTGLLLEGGSLVSLGLTINSDLSIDGVTFDGNNLAFDYTASSGLFTMSGSTSVAIAVPGGQPDVSLDVTFGTSALPDGLVVQNGALVSLGVVVNSSFTVGDVSFEATDLQFDYTANPERFEMAGTATAMISAFSHGAGSEGLSVTFGDADTTALINDPNAQYGLVVTNGSLTSLDMTINANFNVADVSFDAKDLNFEYVAATDTFSMAGTIGASVGGIDSLSVTFGTTNAAVLAINPYAQYGLLVTDGNLVSLDMTINSTFMVEDVLFQAQNLNFDYVAATNTFSMAGTVGATVGGIDSLYVTFGSTDPAVLASDPMAAYGLVIDNGSLSNLYLIVNSTFTVADVNFEAQNLTFDYVAATDRFSMAGTVGATVGGIDKLSVTFGNSSANPATDPADYYGLVITNGNLTSLNMFINSTFIVGGVEFNATNLNFDYVAATDTFSMAGTVGATVGGIDSLYVTFGDKNASQTTDPGDYYGLIITNGSLTSLDLFINSTFEVDGVDVYADNLNFDYIAATDTFSMAGTVGVNIGGIDNLSVTFGDKNASPITDKADYYGLVITDGDLTSLNMFINSSFEVDGVVFYADNLELDYVASTETFTMNGAVGVAIGGLDNLSVTFGAFGTPGLVVTGGDLTSLDLYVNGQFFVDGATFSVDSLQFEYVAATETFSMAGTAGVTLFDIANLAVTFGSNGSPGLVITDGSLVSLDMTVTSNFGIEGLNLAQGNLNFNYTASNDEFTMSGTSSFGLSIAGVTAQFNADLTSAAGPGLIVENGQLVLLDMTANSTITVGNISLNNSQFVITYTAGSNQNGVITPSEFIMDGSATFDIPGFSTYSVLIGGNGTPGLVVENGVFETLNLTVEAPFGIDNLTLGQVDLTASYSASTGIFNFGGNVNLTLDTGAFPSWVVTFFNLPSSLNFGDIGFDLSVDTEDFDAGYAQFWVTIEGEEVGLEVGFNGSIQLTLGNGISGVLLAFAYDAQQAYEQTAAALASAYVSASNGIEGVYNESVEQLNTWAADAGEGIAEFGQDINNGLQDIGNWFSSWGELSGATVFYDPTGAGVYQAGDPTAITSASGLFNLTIPMGAAGGVVVLTGGTDVSTGLPNKITLETPLDSTQINPFTTLLVKVMQDNPSLTTSSATALIDEALGLPSTYDILTENYLQEAQNGNASSAGIFAEEVKIAAAANLAVGLLGGLPGAPAASSLGEDYFASLAQAILSDGGANVNLSSATEDQALLQATAAAAGLTVSDDIASGTGKVTAAVDQAVDAQPVAANTQYLNSIVQIQTLAEATIAPALALVAAGDSSITTVVSAYTEPQVLFLSGAETVGDLDTPAVRISSVTQAVGPGLSTTFVFTVTLTQAPSSLEPVSLSYTTVDGTAIAANGDYTPTSRTLTWAASDDTPQTISVTVNPDAMPVNYKVFEVELSDPVNAVLAEGNGVGAILYSSLYAHVNSTTLLAASSASVAADASVTLTAVVTNLDASNSPGSGQVDFYDGSTKLGSATLDSTGMATLTTSFVNLGQHTITAVYGGYQVVGTTYEPSTSSSITETVTPAVQTITFSSIPNQTFGAGPIYLNATSSSYLPVSVSVVSGPALFDSEGLLRVTGVGTVVVEATQPGDSDTAGATPVEQAFSVSPAILTIMANNTTSVYGAAYPTLSASYIGFIYGESAANLTTLPTLSTESVGTGVGNYAITVSGASDPNYSIHYVAGTLSITPAPLTVIADNQTGVYGAAYPTFTATLVGAVSADSETLEAELSVTTTAPAGSGIGVYEIDDSGITDANYTVTYDPGILTITPATLVITAQNISAVYGAIPQLPVSYTGLVNGDTAASLTVAPVASTATPVTGIGTYEVVVEGAVDPNYMVSYVSGTLTVTPAPLTITADNQSVLYGESLPPLTASYTGLVGADTPASLTTPPVLSLATSPMGVGTYTIDVSGAVDSNYDITYVDGTLTITSAASTITLTPSLSEPVVGQSVTYTATITDAATGSPVTSGSVQFEVDGLKRGQPVALNSDGIASFTSGALPAGELSVTAIFSGSPEYQSNNASLNQIVIDEGTTTVLSASEPTVTYDQSVTVTATVRDTATSQPVAGGFVQFAVDGQIYDFVETNSDGQVAVTLDALTVGVHTITASYVGSPAGIEASSAETTVVVVQPNSALPSWLATGSAATWNGSTKTLTVTGAVTIIADPGSDAPNIVASGSAAVVTIVPATVGFVNLGGITLTNGASIVVPSVGAARTHTNHNVIVLDSNGTTVPTFSIDSSSKLDLGDNDLIIQNGGSEMATIEADATEGRNLAAGNTWTGNGLTSSVAASNDANSGFEQFLLAVALNGNLPSGPFSSWQAGSGSLGLGANDIIVKYTYNGDFNLDGMVDASDAGVINAFYGTISGADFTDGDMFGTGTVDDNDIGFFDAVYGSGTGGANGNQL